MFGAGGEYGGHGFALLPPLREADLADVERAAGVGLPEDYRSFLLEMSAGGAGPHYGLIPFPSGPLDDELSERLTAPFRPEVVQPLIDAHWREVPRGDAYPDEESHARARSAWNNRLDELNEPLLNGTLELSHQGCGYYDVLVLNGRRRGSMWTDDRAADLSVNPVGADGRDVTFADWYLGWLECTEREVFAAP